MKEEILPDLYRLEITLPGNPLKYTNSYVITSEDRNLIVDTGFNRKECLDAFQTGLSVLDIDLEKTDFFSTHLHADHLGLIATFAKTGSTAYMGAVDAKQVEDGGGWDKMLEHGIVSGFSDEVIQSALSRHPGRKHGPEWETIWTHVNDGDIIKIGDFELECIETPGHTWGHICLYEPNKKVLFSGDHILGDITPHIQAWDVDDDPLKSYIQSLNKVAKLDIRLALPGHRNLIDNCRNRIREIKDHHLLRCNEVLNILGRGSKHAFETASQMTWEINAKSWDEFPLMQQWFAAGEALAHLRFLEKRGLIAGKASCDGVILYSLVNRTAELGSMD